MIAMTNQDPLEVMLRLVHHDIAAELRKRKADPTLPPGCRELQQATCVLRAMGAQTALLDEHDAWMRRYYQAGASMV
jgi:hypothetical protein